MEIEVGYRPTPDFEYWTADVAFVSAARWRAIPENGYLEGPPELIVEVLSPSNRLTELHEKRLLCLAHGCREFWMVNLKQRTIEVATAQGHTRLYRDGDRIASFGQFDVTALLG